MQNIVPIPVALFIHTYTPPIAFAVFGVFIVVALIVLKKQRDAVVFAAAFVLTVGTVWVLKHLFAVPRPEDALITLSDYAFPSSHATLSMFTAIMAGWFVKKYTSLSKSGLLLSYSFLALIPIIIGLSRLSIGVHTPFQVFVGFCIGALVPLLVIRGWKKY